MSSLYQPLLMYPVQVGPQHLVVPKGLVTTEGGAQAALSVANSEVGGGGSVTI
jgi:hypothetical protein